MAAASLKGEKLIGMALFKPGWESDYYGNPPVHDVVGVGKVVQVAKLEDGRFNLLLYGVARARVVTVTSESPFREARVELLQDAEPEEERGEALRLSVLGLIEKLGGEVVAGVEGMVSQVPLGALCDLLASGIVSDPAARQGFLEEIDVAARCARLLDLAGRRDLTRRRWPPAPSAN